MPYATVYYHTPLGRFSKLDFSTTKRVPMPNDASSKSFPTPTILARHYSNCGGIQLGKSVYGVDYTPSYHIR